MTGLGDRLICLGAAWLFARQTGRILVADWQYGAYSSEADLPTFPRFFEPTNELAGVPFVADPSPTELRLPRPRYPAIWNDDMLLTHPFRRPDDTIFSHRDAAVAMIRNGEDVTARTVVFDACINDGLVSVADSRTFLGALRPLPHVERAIQDFRRERLGAGPVIGVHMRHGNRAPTGHARYWESLEAAIERCERAVHRAREQIGSAGPVFLCTDSPEVERTMGKRISGIVTRPKEFLEPGHGELHLGRHSNRRRDDAVIETLLLAESNALIRYPPGSFFSFYAAVMMPRRSPPPETVYELQKPWDPADPLAPAIVI